MHLLTSPLTYFILIAVGLAVFGRRLPLWLRVTATIGSCAMLILMCPFGANALVDLLESKVPPASACESNAPGTIVVLSGGFDHEPRDGDDFGALGAETVVRALAGVGAWRGHPEAQLVFAGGGPYAISESAMLQRFAERLGVPSAAIRREDESQTTWENAERLRALAPPLRAPLWLVSSAIHLPRAAIAFRAAGLAACLRASDWRYLPPRGIGYYLPQSSALRKSELALHEIAGSIVYRWRAGATSG